MRWAVAVFKEANIYMETWQPHKYPSPWRLIVPIAVRRHGNTIEVVDPVWTQCHAWSVMRDCAIYFPPDVDAIIYLKEQVNFWREVEIRCDCGDSNFCDRLKHVAEGLWRAKQLSPEGLAAALPSIFSSNFSSN
ncbi:MAG: hypothetical protein RXR01_09750 [Thermoproteus sp.]